MGKQWIPFVYQSIPKKVEVSFYFNDDDLVPRNEGPPFHEQNLIAYDAMLLEQKIEQLP